MDLKKKGILDSVLIGGGLALLLTTTPLSDDRGWNFAKIGDYLNNTTVSAQAAEEGALKVEKPPLDNVIDASEICKHQINNFGSRLF